MADTNAIIEENEQNVGEYDPNPYDNVTVEEALNQLFNRFTPRTVRQAIFTMAENNKPATLVEKTITENGEYTASADNADGYSKVTVDVAGGGGETFEVNATLTDESLIFSKTYEEIKTAISENKKPVLTITVDDVSIVYSMCTYTGSMIVFLGETVIDEGELNQRLVYISPENYHIEKAPTNYALQNVYAYLNE